ncbi:MAG: hypothetical protein NVV62_19565 [Terricaulis sp.]|nr:hypothetical protein [Terricaulis sp.]
MNTSDLSAFQNELASASAALNEFSQVQARRAADDVGAAFDRAGDRIARAMGRAALGGEAAFKRLAKVVLEEFARLALDRIFTQQGGQTPYFWCACGGWGGERGRRLPRR